jgi:RNA polymerase sigma-70 factor (ECF subfamily)
MEPVKPTAPAPPAAAPRPSCMVEADLVRTFNELREELIGTLFYLLGNREDALDAAQDTFMKCWRSPDALEKVQNLKAFIFRVALNTATDLRRSAWRRKVKPLCEGDIMHPIATDAPGLTAEQKEQLERLSRALLDLRTEEKEVFLLRQNGDLTYEEIAQVRRLPVGTVKTQMRSALQKLRKMLA